MKSKTFSRKDIEFSLKSLLRIFQKNVYNLPTPVSVTQYVEANRVLPPGTPFPGPVNMGLTPYLKEIQDCFCASSPVREVACMKSAQSGFSFMAENILVYLIGHAPCPILYTSATQPLLENWSNKRLEPAIRSCDLENRIYVQVEKKGSKRTGDKIMSKEFTGGSLNMASMQSAPALRSDSIKVLIMDELDGAPIFIKKEGDPRAIAEARTSSWGDRKKILYISTPTTTQESKINQLYEMGDQRKYFVPCPLCGEFQILVMSGMKYDRDEDRQLIPGSTHYQCCGCKKMIKEHYKSEMLRYGEWRPTAKSKRSGFRSYHLNALYAPPGMDSWELIAEKWINSYSNPVELRSFINLVLGEPYLERGEAPTYEKVIALRGGYKSGKVPPEALCITLGADIQKNRIECEVVAWGVKKKSWSVSYHVFPVENNEKDIEVEDLDAGCWAALRELLINGVNGRPIQMSFIDSGYATGKVYEFCSQFSSGVHPIMGEGKSKYNRKNIVTARKVPDHSVIRYDLNTDMLKDELASYLRKERPIGKIEYPSGFCHFPEDYPDEFFKQLTAESRLLKTDTNGNKFYVWRNSRNIANEVLDCRCYGLAALYLLASFVCDELDEENEGAISWQSFWSAMQTN